MIQKRKSIIIKLLICLIIIGITMLIKGVISNAAPSLYEVGELDIDGGTVFHLILNYTYLESSSVHTME